MWSEGSAYSLAHWQHGKNSSLNLIPFPCILSEDILTTVAHQLPTLSKGKDNTGASAAEECNCLIFGGIKSCSYSTLHWSLLASGLLRLPIWGPDPNLQSHHQVLIYSYWQGIAICTTATEPHPSQKSSSESPGQSILKLKTDIFGRGSSLLSNVLKEITHSAVLNHKTTSHFLSKVTCLPCRMFPSFLWYKIIYLLSETWKCKLRLLRFIYYLEWTNPQSFKGYLHKKKLCCSFWDPYDTRDSNFGVCQLEKGAVSSQIWVILDAPPDLSCERLFSTRIKLIQIIR